MIRKVTSAVAHMHSQGIIHRGNVFFQQLLSSFCYAFTSFSSFYYCR